MKKLLPLSALLALTTAPLPAEPALHLSTSTLTPTTTLKLSFGKAMVADDQVGTTGPNAMMRIDPPLAGDLKWIEPNVALFERKGIPAIATTYRFSLPSGFKHLDGTAIPETSLQTVRTAPFHYQTGYWRGNTRQPDYFLRFNDAIDPAAVTGKLHFVDKKGTTVAATVRQGIYRDAKGGGPRSHLGTKFPVLEGAGYHQPESGNRNSCRHHRLPGSPPAGGRKLEAGA